MKRFFLLTVLSVCLPVLCSAQAVNMLIPSDARTAGFAAAGAALDADAFVSARNVSAAALSERSGSFGLAYDKWAPSSSSIGIVGFGGYYKFGKLAVALDGRYLNEKPYDIISNVSKVIGTYKPKDMMAGLGLAYGVSETLSIGFAGRFFSSDIAEKVKGSAFCADVNATFRKDGLAAMAGVSNLGSKINYGGSSYALPALAKAGAAYSISGFTASAEADYLFSGAFMAGLGLEYCFADIASLRAGYHYGDAAKALPSFASLGLGLQYSGFSLDFAFLTASETLGNTVLFGLGYSF